MKLNNKKGISLIVLVITIIVMIVLAAAIILSLQSSNIIGRANEAKVKNDIASAKELVAVANSEWLLMTEAKQEQNGGDFVTYAETKLDEAGYEADNYVVSEGGTVEECEAMIGEKKYSNFEDAIYNVINDEPIENNPITVLIKKDIALTSTQIIYYGQNIILDLNGYKITGKNINILNNQGILTIKDTSKEGTGRIESVVDEDKHAKYDAMFDFDNDGYITYEDSNKIFKHTTSVEPVTDEGLLARFDTNKDGIVNNSDGIYLAQVYMSVQHAISVNSRATLIIDETAEGKLIGKATPVYYN